MNSPGVREVKRLCSSRRALIPLLLVLMMIMPTSAMTAPTSGDVAPEGMPPVLAYYYIWFEPNSWNRAKLDIPLLGRYSSDDAEVMRLHIQWAKASGIDGFIVSWKHTDTLSPRLAQLVEISREEDFKLSIIYQGLDFYRAPLPVEQINSDLTYFAETYRHDPVFDLLGKPVVIWSGTWEFDRNDIGIVTEQQRSELNVLASEKGPDDYETIADLVDGNAYYWSSVDPSSYPGYPEKLRQMGTAVQGRGGIWIAPAAPGFDARHIGGQREVPRQDGETLRIQFESALAASPAAVGLISWNEFSENSHIEPSCAFGDRYLTITAELLNMEPPLVTIACDTAALATARAGSEVPPPAPPPDNQASLSRFDWDSSAPEGLANHGTLIRAIALLGVFAGLMTYSAALIVWRALHVQRTPSAPLLSVTQPGRRELLANWRTHESRLHDLRRSLCTPTNLTSIARHTRCFGNPVDA
jgi:hypothetical protein